MGSFENWRESQIEFGFTGSFLITIRVFSLKIFRGLEFSKPRISIGFNSELTEFNVRLLFNHQNQPNHQPTEVAPHLGNRRG